MAHRLLFHAGRGVSGAVCRHFHSTSSGSSRPWLLGTVAAAATVGIVGLSVSPIFADAQTRQRTLFCWGSDQHGQLGVGSGVDLQSPTEASSNTPDDVVQVAAAGLSTSLLTSTGEVLVFGCGAHGRLGTGSISNVTTPHRIPGLKPCKLVAVGENHVAFVSVDGELFTAGRQLRGSLGHDNVNDGKPSQVRGALEGKHVVSVACGWKHTVVATSEGKVYAFGDGRTLALGQGESKSNLASPTLVEALADKHIVEVYAGNGFSMARSRDGELFSWGSNENGQLGQGLSVRYAPVGRVALEPVGVVSCGDLHVLAVSVDGHKLFAFGCGSDGRTGLGTTEDTSMPQEVPGMDNVQFSLIAAGGSHSVAATTNSRLFTWGKGRNGQLGQGDQIASVAAPRTRPVEIKSLGDAVSIACGKDHSCVIVEA